MAAKHRIFVIDDYPDAAELLAQTLAVACAGSETRFALDGFVGLAITRDWLPDVVIADIETPLLSGIVTALETHHHRRPNRESHLEERPDGQGSIRRS